MYASDFDPYGQRKKKFVLFPENKQHPLVAAAQLLVIFIFLRFTMLVAGIWVVRVPVVDDLLIKLVRLLPIH